MCLIQGKGDVRLGLIHGLIGDDEVVKQLAGRLGCLGKVIGEQKVRDLGALAHDSQPVGQLVVILGEGQGDVEALVANLLHAVLVDNGPDKSVVVALQVLGAQLRRAGDSGDQHVLLAVKGVDGGLHGVLGHVEAVKEQAQSGLGDGHERVEPADQGELGIHKGDVLTAGRVGCKLKERLLLEGLRRLGKVRGLPLTAAAASPRGGPVAKADEGKLGGQGLGVRLDPFLGLGPVHARADNVQGEYEEDAGEDDALGLEVVQRVSLVEAVPLCKGARRGQGRVGTEVGAAYDGSKGLGRGVCGLCKVGEVCSRVEDDKVSTELTMIPSGRRAAMGLLQCVN